MFGLFKKTPAKPELPDELLAYFQNQFHWLIENFGKELLTKNILVPESSLFPFVFDGTEAPAWKTLKILCSQMEIDPAEIHLDFFAEIPSRINAGPTDFYLQASKSAKFALGLYQGIQEDRKHHIWLEKGLLSNPEKFVATLAHELAHKRLLGEFKLSAKYDTDHELLTEMFCVFSGLGIFNANQSFNFKKGFDGWSYQWGGYLREQSWGFLLALYALLRNESEPEWLKYLSANLKKDFSVSMKWLVKTGAGDTFLSTKWKNNTPLKNINMNLTGKWKKNSIYGPNYKNAGASLYSDIDLLDNEGTISGNGKDVKGAGVQTPSITLTGTVRNNSVKFSLKYGNGPRTDESGNTVNEDKQNSSVEYTGYYSPFLDAIIGDWMIVIRDPERGELNGGSGTFEMKRFEAEKS